MSVRYTILDPTGNITALAETERDAALAARLMAAEPTVEQVGFVRFPKPGEAELEMAGGEFCGNATLSTGVLGCLRWGIPEITVRASGAARPLAVAATRLNEAEFDVSGELPLPERIAMERLPSPDGEITLPVVRFPGIAHAIVTEKLPRSEAERLVKHWCKTLRVDGMGVLQWDETTGRMTPLVYVPSAGTLFWESSCASGTAAIGAWTAQRDGRAVTLAIRQPGGTLEITSDGQSLRLHETIRIVKNAEI